MEEEVSLYFHIPFCKKKCPYCHFYVTKESEEEKDLLLECFITSWQKHKHLLQDKKLVSIYLGGGTPSLFGPKRVGLLLEKIFKFISIPDEIEITLEVNPENARFELMQAYAQAGINRVSLGVQSFDDEMLKTLGRGHSASQSKEAILDAKRAGFDNITIDLMYELPYQKVENWKRELSLLHTLPITHLSLYNLTFEEGTAFFAKRKALLPHVPSQEQGVLLIDEAVNIFTQAGFNRYEISAFCKGGYSSYHNLGYWIGRPFLGFGPSAFSYWEKRRYRNVSNLKKYSDAILHAKGEEIDFEEKLLDEESQKELMAIHLRLLEGVKVDIFEEKNGALSSSLKANIEKLIKEGFLHKEKERLKLTTHGLLFYDTVASELL